MKSKFLYRTLILLIIVILLFLISLLTEIDINSLLNFSNSNQKTEKIVTKIIDGDTIIVEGGETIRLLGIDCDEKGKKCFTPAKNYIETLLLNQKVVLEQENEDKDQYKRSLRYIFLNNENINLKMVAEGYCIARFVEDTKYKQEIQQAESNAIQNKIGCKWS